jgi:uncharacterized protein YyaL (SSP411 family)
MPNRLAAEKSPYLRQHADNPVDWRPWGDEALALAVAEQKPIFLSIGYSSCHWCHVMAHESFENAAVAKVLNHDFIAVKVDREERPDLDRVYMTYVQQTTGHGGWPLSVWLTPQGHPFYGGTYFPPADHRGRPGFVTVLNAITQHWREQRARIESGAAEVVAALSRPAAGGGPQVVGPATLVEAAGEAWEKGLLHFHEEYDAPWGGFGGAPKFPRASVINLLFRIAAMQGAKSDPGAAAAGMAVRTLQKMAEGGLHDHVGGGFHRYSVDARWHVPHFEKMLYDQAQIALNYLEAKQATGREVFAWIARGIFDYVLRDLAGPHGEFYSAEDADSVPPEAAPDDEGKVTGDGKHLSVEGAFYVWTKAEIDGVLGGLPVGGAPSPRRNDAAPGGGTRPTADADFFCAHYGVKPDGNVEEDPHGEFRGKNVLMQQQSLAVTAREFELGIEAAGGRLLDCLEKLRTRRAQRPRPLLDDKVITAWNGLMISALAKGQQILGNKADEGGDGPPGRPPGAAHPPAASYLDQATRAAEFLRLELYDPASGTLYRSWREGRSAIPGFAEDYAYLIQGLLDLYEAGFEIRWLQWAERLQAAMDERFWDAENGGYYNSRADDPTVIARLKEEYDGAEPAPNSVATANLVRLDWMIGAGGGAESTREASLARGEGTAPLTVSYRDRALRTIDALRPQWSRVPQALPQMLCALEWALAEPRTVVLAGDPGAAEFRALAAVLVEKPGQRCVLLCADGAAGQKWLAARKEYLAEMKPIQGRATAYVCENFSCQAPVTEPADLRRLLG